MSVHEDKYISANGTHDIYYYVWEPTDVSGAKGIVQLLHGMNEHKARYERFAAFLAQNGYIVCQNEHLGHGKSIGADGVFGWFGEKDGHKTLVDDVYKLSVIMKERYPGKPLAMFGHSMGSFVARKYVQLYGGGLCAAVFSGTCGTGALYRVMRVLASCMASVKGTRASGAFFAKMSANMYNARFKPIKTGKEWLSRDASVGETFAADGLSAFNFSLGAYRDLFTIMCEITAKKWFAEYPKGLPTFLMSGVDDPVGDYGRGVLNTYAKLITNGAKRVFIRLYEGGRHEMLNELNKDEVYADVLRFLDEKSFEDPVFGGGNPEIVKVKR